MTTTERINDLMREIAANQEIQKRNRPESEEWKAASFRLAPLFAEMAWYQASGENTDVRGDAK